MKAHSPTALLRRRHREGTKRRRAGYVAPTSPAHRSRLAWSTIIVRTSHAAMARELSELYHVSVGNIVMMLIHTEYLRTLAETQPEKATILEKELNERFNFSFEKDDDINNP